MQNEEVTHREIYERLLQVENEVKSLKENTANMVSAFNAASGAFTALEWIAKVTKPIIYIGGIIIAVVMWVKGIK